MKRINESTKVTLTIGQLKKLIKESVDEDSGEETSDFVGAQKFTYAELEEAWNELRAKVDSDPQYEEFTYIYDIRNGYDTTEERNYDANRWHMDFSLDSIVDELESIPEMITAGHLEVYWNDEEFWKAGSDDHGIFIRDGKISKVY